ncbi:hypothetical protein MMC34_007824 [Xylographa carneopallida]|nr:hypothetical protein [Xylographa carneopallida]
MSPVPNINGVASLETGSLHRESSSTFDENAAARVLFFFITPPSSQGSPSRDQLETSLDSAPMTGVAPIVPLSASNYSMLLCLDIGTTINVILDKAAMAEKLARVRASKALDESPEMKEAAGLLALLQTTPAPWYMFHSKRLAHHHNSGQEAVNGMDDFDPDATEDEELPEDESQEQLIVPDQQEGGSPTIRALLVSAKAAGKQREKDDRPTFVNSSKPVSPPAAEKSSASKVCKRGRTGVKGSASPKTTGKRYEFVNHTTSDFAEHKRKRALPTLRKSAGDGESPAEDEAPGTLSVMPAESLPTPPPRTTSASTLDTSRRPSRVGKSKLSRTPDGVDGEDNDGKPKQERTTKSGRTIKNTEKWTTSENRHK